MSDTNDRILTVLEEMRDILRQQADRVTATLKSFADVNRVSNQKYQESLEASHKAYQDSQATYKKRMENQITRLLDSRPWRATVFVLSLAVIALSLAINVVLRILRY